MTTYKFLLQREEGLEDIGTVFETIHHLTSNDETVVAKTLRAVADQLDPPKVVKTMRGVNSSI